MFLLLFGLFLCCRRLSVVFVALVFVVHVLLCCVVVCCSNDVVTLLSIGCCLIVSCGLLFLFLFFLVW